MYEIRICCRTHVWTKWIKNQMAGTEILYVWNTDSNDYFVTFLALGSGMKKDWLMGNEKWKVWFVFMK